MILHYQFPFYRSLHRWICTLLAVWGLTSAAFPQQSPPQIGIFAGFHTQSSWAVGGHGFHTGLRYGRHEAQFGYQAPSGRHTRLVSYRFYFPKVSSHFRPYVAITAASGFIKRYFSIIGYNENHVYDANTSSISIGLGNSFQIWRGASAFFQVGLGRDGFDIPPLELHRRFIGLQAQAGLRYEILLRGSHPQQGLNPDRLLTNNRFHLRFFGSFVPSFFPFGPIIRLGAPSVTGAVEYSVRPWLRPYLGAEFSPLENPYARPPMFKPIGYAGIAGGARLIPVQRKAWAYFTEVGFVAHTRKKWNFWGLRPKIGNGFLFRMMPGLELEAMASYEMYDFFPFVRYSAGLNLNTELIWRHQK